MSKNINFILKIFYKKLPIFAALEVHGRLFTFEAIFVGTVVTATLLLATEDAARSVVCESSFKIFASIAFLFKNKK